MPNQFWFQVTSEIILEHEEGKEKSKLLKSKLILDTSDNLDKKRYLQADGSYSRDAIQVVTHALVTGLITHIKACKEYKWWEEKEHLTYIKETLDKMFDLPTKVGKTDINDHS